MVVETVRQSACRWFDFVPGHHLFKHLRGSAGEQAESVCNRVHLSAGIPAGARRARALLCFHARLGCEVGSGDIARGPGLGVVVDRQAQCREDKQADRETVV